MILFSNMEIIDNCIIFLIGIYTFSVAAVYLHNTRETSKLRGYNIAKDTMLMYNIYAIHMDPKYWDDPKEFRPERFLDEQGQYYRPEAFIPFGIGRLLQSLI